MMETAEDGLCSDVTESLDGTKHRRILGQSKMWSDMVVVGSIGLEDPAQMAVDRAFGSDTMGVSQEIQPTNFHRSGKSP